MFDMSSNLNFGPEFILSYCVSLGFIWLFCVCLNKLILKPNETSQTEEARLPPPRKEQFLDFFLRKDVSQRVRIILPFISMFFWMTILFVLNNIKTNKVSWISWIKAKGDSNQAFSSMFIAPKGTLSLSLSLRWLWTLLIWWRIPMICWTPTRCSAGQSKTPKWT